MRHLISSIFLMVVLLATFSSVFAQPRAHSIDSLKVLLKQSKPDTGRANLLLELARSYVLKPGDLASDLDTALLLVRQGYSISRHFHFPKGEGNAYLIGAEAYRWKGDIQQARRFGQTAINRFTKNGNIAELAAAYMELGNSYSNGIEELKQKIRHYERSLPLFRQVRQKEREAITLRMLAEFYYIQQNNLKAITLAKQSLSVYQQINYPDMQGIYDLLGNMSLSTGDFKQALEFGLLALKTAELRRDTTTQLCTIYNRIGLTYYQLLDYKSALRYFQAAFLRAKSHNDIALISLTGHNTANAFKRLGHYKQSLALQKNLLQTYPTMDLAQKAMIMSSIVNNYHSLDMKGEIANVQYYSNQLMDQLDQLRKLNREYEVVALTYPVLIDFYITSHQFVQARTLLARLESHVNRSGILRERSANQRLQFRLDSAQGNYLSAIKHFYLYKELQDSLNNERKNKEVARLSVEFQTEKKEQELKLKEANITLLKQANHVQEANLQQQKNQRNSLIGGSALLLALLGVTYNRYRLKQRNNQQLEIKQQLIDQKNQTLQQVLSEKEQLLEEREWMLKEIHHRVKNNLQVISSMLNAQFNFLQDPSALTAIRESQNRVQVMALIHQKLYQSDNLAQIGMQEYIHEIVDYLIESFDRFDSVRAQVSIADVHFDVSLATPLGLIINEALTNSLKYAFPQGRRGEVSVALRPLADQTYQLTITDDGIGLPPDFDVTRSKTLGLTMIRGLSKQIKGQLSIIQNSGVEICLQFSAVNKSVKMLIKSADTYTNVSKK
ncbi:unnamed protein product [Fibrisoma limi BUZ 3]|uniref:histidine kinase n=1 Tax=Fibrisoma limi BUZ 3 TaxID=1185876 RepID=I2GLR7_9BACT|nr:histidine kinase dimerization/phosphoacceptor domain -containing protein [Fibrisoma limi]CCH54843.1 unnamed protein product [Fibrisoma limi BUZ 3]